jgi:MFS family permease
MIDAGSFLGGTYIGYLGDKYGHRALYLSPLLLLSSIIMFVVSFSLTDIAWQYYVAMFLIGVSIGGPYNIIGTVITIDLGQQTGGKNVTSISSLVEGSAALFAALSQMLISYLS